MKNFEIIPHTADLRIKIRGDNLVELFQAGVFGMGEYMSGISKLSKLSKLSKEIKITAPDSTALLIDFLSEVLTAMHIKKVVFNKVEFKELSEIKLEAVVSGKKVDKFEKDIKAVTYHEAEIVKNKKGELETNIVCDI